MQSDARWIKPQSVEVPPDFQAMIGGHPLVAETLYRRGIRTIPEAQAFLDPDYYPPTPPEELPDIEIACQLLATAIQEKAHILIWGDFDVDGQTATTLLVEGLQQLNANVHYHIPVRAVESHGIAPAILEEQLQQGVDLLLTCDTGVTEHESIQLARSSNIPVIVTDHHQLTHTLPNANAVVNPQRLSSNHPLATLPGVGVAYKLLEALNKYLHHSFDSGHTLELVALGIVADVAQLEGDTRSLLQKGLIQLRQTKRIGLQTLFQNANLNPQHLTEDHIGFQIAPRLNAVGRLSDANPIVDLLITDDIGRARVLATQIEAFNAKRRFITRQIEKAAEAHLNASPDDRRASAIVLHNPNWHPGVVGIVASRLVEQYHKPVLLLTGKERLHGSARSVPGIDITEAIRSQADLLENFGGHPMAAGITLAQENYLDFKRRLLIKIAQQTEKVQFTPEIEITSDLSLSQIEEDFVKEIQRLAPFGPGNPPLQFLIHNLRITSATNIGAQGEHRQVIAADEKGHQQRFIWWNGGDEPLPEAQFDLICKLQQSNYQGVEQVSAEWIDYRLSKKGLVELTQRHIEVIDYRQETKPKEILPRLRTSESQSLIWGEGDLSNQDPMMRRHQLQAAKTLIIWTAPPSFPVFQQALQATTPQKIILFGIDPHLDSNRDFLKRLAGLTKYALKRKKGRAKLVEFAAACAATEEAVRIGLKIWEARGKIEVHLEEDGEIILSTELCDPDRTAETILEEVLNNLLNETKAFRRYFQTANAPSLLPTYETEVFTPK